MSNILANSTFSNFDIDQTSAIFDYSLTLYTNQWSGNQIPYTYDLIFENHTNTTDKVSIAIGNDITNEQLEALQSSSIMSAYWVDNTTLRLESYGEKLIIDVPIILSIISVRKKFVNGAHAENHAKNGVDPITPEMIGASTLEDLERAISAIPTPDVSGQINEHNTNSESHSDIRKSVSDIIDGTSSAKNATNIYSSGSTSKAYLLGTASASNGNKATIYNASVYTEGSVLYGAAWNDYAEYRDQKEEIKPGYCVASMNDGKVYKTTEKYQACDGIVSDTFGFAIGETEKCKTPLAVAGRVLAYFDGNIKDYQAGDTVCAGPEGRVMKMTREEIKEYPDRILGHVSEIPNYDTWGEREIQVNNRIWIRIK